MTVLVSDWHSVWTSVHKKTISFLIIHPSLAYIQIYSYSTFVQRNSTESEKLVNIYFQWFTKYTIQSRKRRAITEIQIPPLLKWGQTLQLSRDNEPNLHEG